VRLTRVLPTLQRQTSKYCAPLRRPWTRSGEGLLSDRESSWGLDVVPVLLREGVGLLLKTLLSL
jgi:hypothetical protein